LSILQTAIICFSHSGILPIHCQIRTYENYLTHFTHLDHLVAVQDQNEQAQAVKVADVISSLLAHTNHPRKKYPRIIPAKKKATNIAAAVTLR